MFDALLTIDELETGTRALASDPRVTVTPLGLSRAGRLIEMVSIGAGSFGDRGRDALIVGVPHANEPAGAVTIERMIALLLDDRADRCDCRWHFIKAIDPDGLALNGGWLKQPRTIVNYLHHFFRPALERQPETTFPLDIPDAQFDASTPENISWQKAFALTRPSLHASLHHCDYGGAFFSLSRALPEAIAGLEQALDHSGFGVHELDGDVMTADHWAPAISPYPSVAELMARARNAGASWAWPWTMGDMSPGFGETRYGTFTLIAEAPLWTSTALRDPASSGVSGREQRLLLAAVAARVSELAGRYCAAFTGTALPPDGQECLHALADSLRLMPPAHTGQAAAQPGDKVMLSRHRFEMLHTRHVLFTLRSCGLLLSLAKLVLAANPGHAIACSAADEAGQLLEQELAALETHSTLTPVPLEVFTAFQMQSIFVCAQALNAAR